MSEITFAKVLAGAMIGCLPPLKTFKDQSNSLKFLDS
jgi:hypothetical protein